MYLITLLLVRNFAQHNNYDLLQSDWLPKKFIMVRNTSKQARSAIHGFK